MAIENKGTDMKDWMVLNCFKYRGFDFVTFRGKYSKKHLRRYAHGTTTSDNLDELKQWMDRKIAKSIDPKTPAVNVRYDHHSERISIAITKLENKIKRHNERALPNPDWADVGDLDHVADQLEELNRFFNIAD
jgi:hypothetical protein